MPPLDVEAEVLRNTRLSADYNVLAPRGPGHRRRERRPASS